MSKKETNNSQEQINAAIAAYIKSATEIDEWRAKAAQELDERRAKAAQELDQQRAKEAEERSKKLEHYMRNIAKQCGNTTGNIGNITEEFFFRAFNANKRVKHIAFDHIERNATYSSEHDPGIITGELDITLHNGSCVLVVEVKYKCHLNDIIALYNKMKYIQTQTFTQFEHKKVLFGVASEKFNPDAATRAQEYGLILFHPQGQQIRTDVSACSYFGNTATTRTQ